MKLTITLLLVLGLAATAFFFGWAELVLPAGTYGVAFTKSGGWDEHALVPGGITWRWERLIPTNMTLYAFDLTPQEVKRSVSGLLPSADRYAAEIDIDPADFAYELEITCQLRLRAEHLPRLAAEAELRPEALLKWYRQAAGSAADAAVAALLSEEGAALLLAPQALQEKVQRWTAARHPELEVMAIDLIPYSIPDPDLYLRAKAAFAARINVQQRVRLAVIDELSQTREQAYQRAEMLRTLGRALDEFPELVELLIRSDVRLLNQVLGIAEVPSR